MSDAAAQAAPRKQNANIRYGAQNQNLPVVGRTVADVRKELSSPLAWNVPMETNAFIGKKQLDDSYVIQEHDELVFHRRTGEKGK